MLRNIWTSITTTQHVVWCEYYSEHSENMGWWLLVVGRSRQLCGGAAATEPRIPAAPDPASASAAASSPCHGHRRRLGWGVYSWVLASRRDLPHYQDLVPLYSSFQCCWISWLGPAGPGLVRADLVCDFWADLCNSWLTPITHGHCPARTAGNAAPVRGPGPGYT